MFAGALFMTPTPDEANQLEYAAIAEITGIEYIDMVALDQVRYEMDFSKADPEETLALFLNASVTLKEKEDDETIVLDDATVIVEEGGSNSTKYEIHDYNDYVHVIDILNETPKSDLIDAIDHLYSLNGNKRSGYKISVKIDYYDIETVMKKIYMSEEERELVRIIIEADIASSESFIGNLPDMIDMSKIDESTFIWSTPDLHEISSGYGNRIHPVTGYKSFHDGIDITGNNAHGKPIAAICDGIVSFVGSGSKAGKYVKIEHVVDGKIIESAYMHMSVIKVKKGQEVKQGYVIGAVGNTGRSTGAHLHFSIHIDGKSVNPMQLYK
jgi:hypothetical protein